MGTPLEIPFQRKLFQSSHLLRRVGVLCIYPELGITKYFTDTSHHSPIPLQQTDKDSTEEIKKNSNIEETSNMDESKINSGN